MERPHNQLLTNENDLWKKDKESSQYLDLFHNFRHVKDNEISIKLRERGNKQFNQKNYLEARELYNQSLCFAEIGSENVPLAYSNRSASFFHMNMFEQAINDIVLATTAKQFPERIQSKLDERMKLSQKALKICGPTPEFVAELSYKANKNYPALADVVDIRNDSTFGRHLVANSDIPVGRTVLVEDAFVFVPDEDKSFCHTCHRGEISFIACPECPDAVFCDAKCMKLNLRHIWECGTVINQLDCNFKFQAQVILNAIELFPDVESLIKLVEEIMRDNNELPKSLIDKKSKYHLFLKLKTSNYDPAELHSMHKMYNSLLSIPKISLTFDTEKKKRFLMHLITHHHLVMLANNTQTSISTHFLPKIKSLLNHSCYENLVQLQEYNKQILVTCRPIKAGDQLFIDYRPGLNEKSSIEKKWDFVCKCEKCSPTKTSEFSLFDNADFKFIMENSTNSIKAPDVVRKCEQLLSEFGRGAWSHEIKQVIQVYENRLLHAHMCDYFKKLKQLRSM